MNEAFVGTWSVHPHTGEILQYDDGWVASEQGRPLSLSLPFTPGNQPHRGDAVRAYFENLLPDSKAIRERIAHRFQAGSTQAFALLAEVGRDCAGALHDMTRRHWLAVGTAHGIMTPDGRSAEVVLDEMIAQTPEVVHTVRAQLPDGFPAHVADSILTGLQTAAEKLAR